MNCSKGNVVLVAYPFSDFSTAKVRPAVVASAYGGRYADVFIVPLTSRLEGLAEGEFELESWRDAGLHIPTAVKRGWFLIADDLIIKCSGTISANDFSRLKISPKSRLEL